MYYVHALQNQNIVKSLYMHKFYIFCYGNAYLQPLKVTQHWSLENWRPLKYTTLIKLVNLFHIDLAESL